jgi:DHA1 family bicyclomycin/chloramphenicol resistance-like MFS transporter
MKPQPSHAALVLMLGALTALTPFSIDLYLPAFPQIARAFGTDVPAVAFSLSSYFIGLAMGQLIYGPLMDRFGRKKPLIVGLLIYLMGTVGCWFSTSVNALIVFRFIQALGGCSAGVGAFAMVRDLFEPKESAKIFSLLILILGASPLFAPSIGGFLSAHFGWPSVFAALFLMAAVILAVVVRWLPESHGGDEQHALHPLAILKTYASIFRNRYFSVYALSGAVAFSGLFVYLAASPSIFMEIFGLSNQTYGWTFSIVAAGFVGMSQLNIVLLRRHGSEKILAASLAVFTAASLVFLVCAFRGWLNIYGVIGVFFIFLSCVGLANPNSSALAMAPFSTNAGSAAAMLGFVQMTIGAVASTCVGALKAQQLLPLAAIFVFTSILSLIILTLGHRALREKRDPSAVFSSTS